MRRLRTALGPDRQACLSMSLAVLGALWTVVEVMSFFFEDLSWLRLPIVLPTLAGVALVVGVSLGVRPRSIDLPIGASDTFITVKVGSIFSEPGARVIAVNDFYDWEIGKHISPLSLHGRFISQYFPHNQSEAFCDQVDDALRGVVGKEVERPSGRSRRYPIGSVARLDIAHERYLLLALTHTDVTTLKAQADLADLWQALEGLWSRSRHLADGQDIIVPLIGSGLSGVGLPARHLLDVLLISLIDSTKHRKVAGRVVIVLTEVHHDLIDLGDVARQWQG